MLLLFSADPCARPHAVCREPVSQTASNKRSRLIEGNTFPGGTRGVTGSLFPFSSISGQALTVDGQAAAAFPGANRKKARRCYII